jgi:succinate-semialdehyde dehydrogenase / glutarate-semialdehyde dehydrogenase
MPKYSIPGGPARAPLPFREGKALPYRSVNPATGEVITTFANHTDAELQSALSVAHSLYKSDWSKGPIQPRLDVLSRLADLLDCRIEELARILTQEMGKRISEARFEVELTAEIARFYATNAATFLAAAKIQTPQGDAWVEYHPIGIIVAVEPWNFPYYQLVRVAAPNIAIGNPCSPSMPASCPGRRSRSRMLSRPLARRREHGQISSLPANRLPR